MIQSINQSTECAHNDSNQSKKKVFLPLSFYEKKQKQKKKTTMDKTKKLKQDFSRIEDVHKIWKF